MNLVPCYISRRCVKPMDCLSCLTFGPYMNSIKMNWWVWYKMNVNMLFAELKKVTETGKAELIISPRAF